MILLFLFLFIGTAQAGEWIVDKEGQKLTKILADKDGNAILLECQDGVPCEYTASARHLFACHQKMQEAMKWIDPITKSYNENKRKDPAFDFAKQYREYDKNQAKWDTTMKECVGRDR